MLLKMKNKANKLKTRLRSRTRLTYKRILIFSIYGTALLILITIVFNLADIKKIKANAVEIIEVEEQKFITDMSVPAPQIKDQKIAGPNTIFIHKVKKSQDSPSPKNE